MIKTYPKWTRTDRNYLNLPLVHNINSIKLLEYAMWHSWLEVNVGFLESNPKIGYFVTNTFLIGYCQAKPTFSWSELWWRGTCKSSLLVEQLLYNCRYSLHFVLKIVWDLSFMISSTFISFLINLKNNW